MLKSPMILDCPLVVTEDDGSRWASLDEATFSGIPHHAVCIFKDGDKWCAVYGDFINLEESVAGFGKDFTEAIDELQRNTPHMHINSGIRGDDSCKRCERDLRHPCHMAEVE